MKPKEFKHKVLKKRIHEVSTEKNYSGEASPYWDHMHNDSRAQGDGMDDKQEDAFANPDVMSEENCVTHRPLTEVGKLMLQAVQEATVDMTPQQQSIVRLMHEGVWSEKEGQLLYTEQAIAEALGIARQTVNTILLRVKAKVRRRYEILKATKE